jgi:hypothetical protein
MYIVANSEVIGLAPGANRKLQPQRCKKLRRDEQPSLFENKKFLLCN